MFRDRGFAVQWMLVRNYVLRTLGLLDSRRVPSEIAGDANVLFLCHGNVFRSPMAEALFAREVSRSRNGAFRFRSAGLETHPGLPAPEEARTAATEQGISLADHRTTLLTTEIVDAADVIVVMDYENEATLLARFPSARGKVVMLGAFDPRADSPGPAVADPYGKGLPVVKACYDRLGRAVAQLHADLVHHSFARPERAANPARQAMRAALTSRAMSALWRPFTSGVVTILMLHRFADEDRGIRGHDPVLLDRMLATLRRHRFHLTSLDQWIEASRGGRPLPARSVIFTVDDGYEDFFSIGLPVFARYDCPVTTFLVTDPVDKGSWYWWDKLYCAFDLSDRRSLTLDVEQATWSFRWSTQSQRRQVQRALVERLKRLPEDPKLAALDQLVAELAVDLPDRPPERYRAMSWDHVRQASRMGASFGGHTTSHPRLAACEAAEAQRQIRESVDCVRARASAFVPMFCYPYGDAGAFTSRDERTCSELGLVGALSTTPGFAAGRALTDPTYAKRFRIPRYPLPDSERTLLQIVSGLERATSSVRRLVPFLGAPRTTAERSAT